PSFHREERLSPLRIQMDSSGTAMVDDCSPMRWSSVYGEAPDRRSESEKAADNLVLGAEKFVAQRIRLKQHYCWLERDVVPLKSLSGWSAVVRFQARAAMKSVVRLIDYEREQQCYPAMTHGYGSPLPTKAGYDRMETDEMASPRTGRRRVRPLELTP
ncbi:hypothetical protein PFISCL1PPCAC_11303, partial [Pristionchus fissidentatus]